MKKMNLKRLLFLKQELLYKLVTTLKKDEKEIRH
jgi:hypothetical protein